MPQTLEQVRAQQGAQSPNCSAQVVVGLLLVATLPTLKLTPDRTGTWSRLMIDCTVGCSVVIIELVLCEICDWVQPLVRFIAWKLFLSALLWLLVFAIPATQLLLHFSIQSSSRLWRYSLPTLLFFSYLLSFYVLGWYLPTETTQ
jgi:hypothetical protein